MPDRESPRVSVLLVEDSPDDVLLTREALRDAEVANELQVAKDGEQAMAIVRREGEHADARRPDLILLDLNLPRKDGREVLAELKQDPELRGIPVVILTTSASERDLLHATTDTSTPTSASPSTSIAFLEVIKAIDQFWLGVVSLPPGEPLGAST